MSARSDRDAAPLDLLGIGIGPFNLGLAALLAPVPTLRAVFLDKAPEFRWHPGMLLPDTHLQVPFLADLVTMVDPTSAFSFLSYLHARDRLYDFYFYERFHVPRREYDDYCRWAAARLDSCRFGETVRRVTFDRDRAVFRVETDHGAYHARSVSVGTGSVPYVPPAFASVQDDAVVHTSALAWSLEALAAHGDVAVIGGGQSAAEAVLALMSSRRSHAAPGRRIYWLTRGPGFLPMEYSKLGLAQFFRPEYMRFFHGLAPRLRAELPEKQGQLYKGISAETIAKIYDLLYEETVGGAEPSVVLLPLQCVETCRRGGDRLVLGARHQWTQAHADLAVDAVVLGTGYHHPLPDVLAELPLELDERERLQVDADHRIRWRHADAADLFAQSLELGSHGVGTPDLGLGAYRNARIANCVAGRALYRLPADGGFHRFAVPGRTDR
jgi:lysine/ornithine N-monooxygenase